MQDGFFRCFGADTLKAFGTLLFPRGFPPGISLTTAGLDSLGQEWPTAQELDVSMKEVKGEQPSVRCCWLIERLIESLLGRIEE